jgi:hypothetical protein
VIDCIQYWFPIHVLETADRLTLLAVVIALSAYLATIRLFAVDKRGKLRERLEEIEGELADPNLTDPAKRTRLTNAMQEIENRRENIRFKLRLLIIPDIFMVSSAVLLGLATLYSKSYLWFLPAGVYSFTIAGIILLIMHISAWVATLRN